MWNGDKTSPHWVNSNALLPQPPMTEEQRAALTAVLEKASDKRLRAQFAVDASLIGGVLARIGSTVYDGSVRGQLQVLKRRLSAESSS